MAHRKIRKSKFKPPCADSKKIPYAKWGPEHMVLLKFHLQMIFREMILGRVIKSFEIDDLLSTIVLTFPSEETVKFEPSFIYLDKSMKLDFFEEITQTRIQLKVNLREVCYESLEAKMIQMVRMFPAQRESIYQTALRTIRMYIAKNQHSKLKNAQVVEKYDNNVLKTSLLVDWENNKMIEKFLLNIRIFKNSVELRKINNKKSLIRNSCTINILDSHLQEDPKKFIKKVKSIAWNFFSLETQSA